MAKVYVAVQSATTVDYAILSAEKVLSAHATLEGAKAAVPGQRGDEWKQSEEGTWYVEETEWRSSKPEEMHHYIAELEVRP